jgi:hypothetical protein
MGNIFASYVIKGDLKVLRWNLNRIHDLLADWYPKKSANGVGFSKLVVV